MVSPEALIMPRRQALHWGNPPAGTYSAPVYLGLQRGMFGPPDLALEAHDNVNGAEYTKALLAGKFDMGHMGTPPLFAALAATDEYVIVGQGVVRYPCFWVVAPAEISSFGDLVGKTIGLNRRQTCSHSIIRTLLGWEGLDESAVHLEILENYTRITDEIGSGDLAAAVLCEPHVSYAERAHGWRVLVEGREVIDPSNFGICVYARRRLLESEPELVAHLVRDYARCVRYAMDHMDEAAEVLDGKFPGFLAEDIERAIRRDTPNWTSDTTVDEAFLSVVVAELKEQSVVPSDFALGAEIMCTDLIA